jgi:hypothetical protein
MIFLGLGWGATRNPLIASLAGFVLHSVAILVVVREELNSLGLGFMLIILAALAWAVVVSAKVRRRLG